MRPLTSKSYPITYNTPFTVTILGSSSATPAFGRNPTAQLVHHAGGYFLVDCGEGTQMQLRRYSIKFQRISHIFISHLHGDHFLGLPGLLSTMNLLGRTEPLHLHGEKDLITLINTTHSISRTVLGYPLLFYPIDFGASKVVYEDEQLSVSTLIMRHSVPCCGFLFSEKPFQRKLVKEKLEEYAIPVFQLEQIKEGGDYTTPSGKKIPNSELTLSPLPPRRYAYCSDTMYNEDILPLITGVNLLYHEATFTSEKQERARQTMHSTAAEAATIAKLAHANRLIIGHFSARYKDLNPLLEEARSIFQNTVLAEDGLVAEVN